MNIRELENNLWGAAKKLRHNSNPTIWMHKVLGLIFLRHITDISSTENKISLKDKSSPAIAETKNDGEHLSYNEYFVPKNAQWNFLRSNAAQPNIGLLIDDAIDALEKLNENLRGIFHRNYADLNEVTQGLGEFVELTESVGLDKKNPKQKESLSYMYEYLLERFAESEGKNGDQFYTPHSIKTLLAEMIAPYKGNLYDGSCGTGGTFIQSEKFIKKRGKTDTLSFYGQEPDRIVLKIAKMNFALHGIHADLQPGDALTNDRHHGLAADYILANPAFSTTRPEENFLQDDTRWQYGVPSEENTDYAWLQHFVSKLSPAGTAGIILKNNSASSTAADASEIRKNLIEAKLVDCIVALPSKLFYNAEANACLWILSKNKTNNRYRDANKEILFIDARKLGVMGSRRKREFTDEDILLLSRTYQRWKNINGDYTEIKGFCKAVSIEEVRKNSYTLMPQKYVSSKAIKKAAAGTLLLILFSFLYFIFSKNGSFTPASKTHDTAITVKPAIVKDSVPPARKLSRKEKKIEADRAVQAKKDSAIVSNTPVEIKPPVEKPKIPLPTPIENTTEGTRYKVKSTAYFYDKPDINTRRRAYITHWNNSYADIRALDEKYGFIYIVFTNHMNQRSKGWLRKRDLTEVKE
jgi:type I restriction enzyme M protein